MATGSWRVKYDGVCSRCGIALRAGEVAVYDRPTGSIHCVLCPSEARRPEASESGVDTPQAGLDPGTAGASAQREYERRRARREERIKDRFGERLGRVVLAVTDDPQSTRAWAIGARGEEQLAHEFDGIEGLNVLNDRRVPGTRGNIDHIVIAPAGVFVVDAKHYEGRIEIRNKGWLLRPEYRLYVGRRDCSHLAEGLGWQAEAVKTALVGAGIDPLPPITSVLCFIDGDWPLFGAPDEFAGVRLVAPKSLRKVATATAALEPKEISRLTAVLGACLPSW